MADYNSDRTGSNIDLTLDKVDALYAKVQPTSTGVDVTGTVTADGLEVTRSPDTVGMSIKTAYGTASEKYSSFKFDNISFSGGDSEIRNLVNGASSTGSALSFHTTHTGTTSLRERFKIDRSGDVQFFEDSGTTAKMVWDASAESLKIGSPAATSGAIKQNFFEVGGKYSTNSADSNQYQTIGFVGSTGFGVTDIFTDAADEKAKNFYMGLLADDPYFNSNRFGIVQGGVERVTIQGYGANAGNVGIGTASPSANLDIEDTTPVIRLSGNGNNADNFNYGEIQFYNRDNSGAGAQIGASIHCETASSAGARGELVFSTNDSGGAEGEDASEAMRIDADGNVGIGTASPNLTGYSASSTVETISVSNNTGALGVLEIGGSRTASGQETGVISFHNNNNATPYAEIRGGRGSTDSAAGDLRLYTGSSERARIDSSGNLLVGKTSKDSSTQGIELRDDGRLVATYDQDNPVFFNRLGNDGAIVKLLKDGATVGAIGANGGRVFITGSGGTNSGGLRFTDGASGAVIAPCNTSGALTNNNADLGGSGIAFKDLYLSGGVYLGGTGAANKLDDYEEGTFTATLRGGTSDPATLITTTSNYTKIGNVVSFQISFENVNTSGYSGQVYLTGLPFTTVSGMRNMAVCSSYNMVSYTGELGAEVASNSNIIYMLDTRSSATWINANHNAGASARYLVITGSYRTNS